MTTDAAAYQGALLRERAAMEQMGKTDRVADVDAELARVGYRPQQRTAPQAETTAPRRARRAPRPEQA